MLFAKAAQAIDMANAKAVRHETKSKLLSYPQNRKNHSCTRYREKFILNAGYSNAETIGAAIEREGGV
ncbi:hypothetical protein K3495_g5251 [Podosphaera aphanis]|nr:hypothetical protein K3495_g5251 [Podosphaera aphanis]